MNFRKLAGYCLVGVGLSALAYFNNGEVIPTRAVATPAPTAAHEKNTSIATTQPQTHQNVLVASVATAGYNCPGLRFPRDEQLISDQIPAGTPFEFDVAGWTDTKTGADVDGQVNFLTYRASAGPKSTTPKGKMMPLELYGNPVTADDLSPDFGGSDYAGALNLIVSRIAELCNR